jgi:ADP-heptose:LPS heptosyltransferase
MDNLKILVIRFSSIGDIVLTSPIVRCIKQQKPQTEIHFLTKQHYLPILQNNPYISKVFVLQDKESMFQLIKQLKEEDYDYIIDLQKNLRSQRIRLALRAKYQTFNKLNVKKWALVHFKKNLLPKVHIVDRYFEAVKKINVANDGQGLDYFLQEEDYIPSDALPISFKDGYIVVVVGAKHLTKQIPTDILIDICKKIEGEILLVGALEDRSKAIKIENAVGARVFNGCGNFSLNQTASLIDKSIGVITPDTGMMHIASARKKNIISLWGNTVTDFGMYPYFPKDSEKKSYIFEVKDLPCRPCSKLGYKKCPKKHFKCMKQQDVNKIVEIANKWVEEEREK